MKLLFKSKVALAVALAASTTLVQQAMAEDNVATEQSTAASNADVEKRLQLEKIVVTAQKTAQFLQDVPSSVDSFRADSIEDEGWNDIGALQNKVPGLVLGGAQARPYLYLRGVGTGKFDIGSDGSIGMFIDEVFSARSSNNLSGVMDIDRIEVLKGPQGTLYGRNTLGGAISMYTKKPTNETEGKIKAAFGNDGYYSYSGSLSGALIDDKLMGRVSATTSDVDGMHGDTVTGNTTNKAVEAARFSLLATPTDDVEITLTASMNTSDSDAVSSSRKGSINFVGPWAAEEAAAFEAAYPDGSTMTAQTIPGFSAIDTNQVSLKVKWYGDSVEVTSITSRSDEEYKELRDFDGSTLDVAISTVDQQSTQWSQELRFNSTVDGFFTFDDRLEWIAGLFYFTDDASRKDEFDFGPDSLLFPPILPGIFPGITSNESDFYVNIDTESYAVFGQATYAITDDLKLTLGLRYTKDEKVFDYTAATNTPGVPVVFEDFEIGDTLEYSSTDPRVSLSYHFAEDVMGYITYASGFKSGGVQYIVGDPALAADSFDEEHLDMIEAGIRSVILDGRVQLNATTYRYDYEGQQLQSVVFVNGAPVAFTRNAGKSIMKGFELDIVALIAEGLTTNLNYAYQDATYDELVVNAGPTGDLSGNTMTRAPKNAVTFGLNYETSLGNAGDLSLQANYSWKDQFFFDFNNKEFQESYGTTNLNAIWRLPGENVSIRVFCNNCSDEEIFVDKVPFPAGSTAQTLDAGRRYGLEATYRF
tara:strand:- start:127 stop:2400 length:2274 start_codon:yes stop_codon:yes gene_type:complete